MLKFTEANKELLYESIYNKVEKKINGDNKELNKGILDMVEKSIGSSDSLKDASDFIIKYTKDSTSTNMIDFVNDADIFNFYLKYQMDIDGVCNEYKFYDKIPSDDNIISLYDYIIKGTKYAVLKLMIELQKNIL